MKAMAQLSAVGVPAGAVLDTQELIDEPSFYERGILQQMTHGERKMVMPTCCPTGSASTPRRSRS